MRILFQEKFGKMLLCQLQLSANEIGAGAVDVRECVAECKQVILATTLNGIDSELSWKGTELFFGADFKERGLLILMVVGLGK